MREIQIQLIADKLREAICQANFNLGERECRALEKAHTQETSQTGRAILNDLLVNKDIAPAECRPLCQDTGIAIIFIEIGQDVHLTGGNLIEVLQETTGSAYTANYLRPSVTRHPLNRVNTGNNTPAIIHTRLVAGDQLKVQFVAKGGGCENMSRMVMLQPSAGREGVIKFVMETIVKASGNPCPPTVVGIGLGGNFELAPLLAKEALLRPLGEPADNPEDAALEKELLDKINQTGIGPMGLGGDSTALAVHIVSHPCHIASMPVAVNLDCHSHRHAEFVI